MAVSRGFYFIRMPYTISSRGAYYIGMLTQISRVYLFKLPEAFACQGKFNHIGGNRDIKSPFSGNKRMLTFGPFSAIREFPLDFSVFLEN